MVITTDRRAYHLTLVSTDATAMAALSWTYPGARILALRRRNADAEAARPIADGVNLETMRFRYAISGDDPPWRPVRAFDDGRKVYIAFPRRIDPEPDPAGPAQTIEIESGFTRPARVAARPGPVGIRSRARRRRCSSSVPMAVASL
jgi:hypothetical protein